MTRKESFKYEQQQLALLAIVLYIQAWNDTQATEVMASVALVLALVPLQKFPIHVDFKIFQWKCPFQNENGIALSMIKFQYYTHQHKIFI